MRRPAEGYDALTSAPDWHPPASDPLAHRHPARLARAQRLPGAGAAGGLGAGLMFFTSAKLRPGVDIVIEATGLSDLVATADLVITGEGCTDFQTAFGKAPVGVAKLANQFGVPVVCLSGSLGQGHHDVLDCGIDALMNIIPCPICLEECMAGVDVFTEEAATRLGMLLKVGMRIEE